MLTARISITVPGLSYNVVLHSPRLYFRIAVFYGATFDTECTATRAWWTNVAEGLSSDESHAAAAHPGERLLGTEDRDDGNREGQGSPRMEIKLNALIDDGKIAALRQIEDALRLDELVDELQEHL